MRYEVRKGYWHPCRGPSTAKTFSVGIGLADSRAAAIYRVGGLVEDWIQVDRLAVRLVEWLNNPKITDRSPIMLPQTSDRSARIRLTPAGRAAGWWTS